MEQQNNNNTKADKNNICLTDVYRLNPMFRIQWESVQESFVLLYPEGMVKLNHSASEILKRCDGTMTIKEIITDIEKEFDTTGLTPDIIEFIHHAILRGWLITK